MALIHTFKKAMEWDGDKNFPNNRNKEKKCPVCGEQLYTWSPFRFRADKTGCFSYMCLKLSTGAYPIGMIVGDKKPFSQKDYKIGGGYIEYPAAGEHSAELREAIKKLLETWGFLDIGFVEPSQGDKSERDTVITGIHKSPLVNITYRSAPKTQRVFCFENRFGVVGLEIGHHENHENEYHGWYVIQSQVYAYGKENLGRQYLYPDVDTISLSYAIDAAQDAERTRLEARKKVVAHGIREKIVHIDSLRKDIARYQKYIAADVKAYEEEFREAYPNKVEERYCQTDEERDKDFFKR